MRAGILGFLGVLLLVGILIFVQVNIGMWCAHNTELLASHYGGSTIILPRWPFIVGVLCTQIVGVPYGLITEVWAHCVEVKGG